MPRSDPKTIWDGQQSTIDATTRAAQNMMTIDQQIHSQIQDIQKQSQLVSNLASGADPSKMVPKGLSGSTIPAVCDIILLRYFNI